MLIGRCGGLIALLTAFEAVPVARGLELEPGLGVPGEASADFLEPAQHAPSTAAPSLEEVLVTARHTLESAQSIPATVTTLSADRIADYELSSLEKLATLTPDLILTRGNSGSGLDMSLRGIGPNFSSIGIEQSVAVVVDGVYYGQGRIIDEAFYDLDHIELLKGPQALFFGKNSTAGVISITTANPGPQREAQIQVGYGLTTESPKGQFIVSGPVTDKLSLRLVVAGQDMLGGYVRNDATPGTYTTIDAATAVSTTHAVPSPDNRDLPAESSVLGRLTATYTPSDVATVTLKASASGNKQGGTSWNDRLWRCPSGSGTFPGSASQPCGDGFHIEQNPVPSDIAATRPDMAREGGQLYSDYQSRGVTARIEAILGRYSLTSVSNYQHYDYTSNSDYDFTAVPAIWADQHNSYSAVSEEVQVLTRAQEPVSFLAGLYYQGTRLDFSQGAVFFGAEDRLAAPTNRYVAVQKNSATDGDTRAIYGQMTWKFLPHWELAAGARYTHETKTSYFIQPYVNPFFTTLYAPNNLLSAEQHFHNFSPELTVSWKPDSGSTLYAAFRTGYKSGGFSNSADDVAGSAGVRDLTFQPETAQGVEVGFKQMALDRRLRLNVDAYRYRFSDLQVDFFDPRDFALITTNAGSAISEGVELETEYLPLPLPGMHLHGSLGYNRAHYESYFGPCYGGQTLAQGCTFVGPAPDYSPLQNLHSKPTADAPRWTGLFGVDYSRPLGGALALGCSADARLSSRYSTSPFAQPLDIQSAYVSLDATVRLSGAGGRWKLAFIGKNLTNRFVVTYASDEPSTGTAPGTATGRLADQLGLFAPARTVELQLIYAR